jgi:hypothetical protein
VPEPDGPQFQNLWDIAMSDANDALDAASDEDLDEAVAESMISDAIGGMVDASQIEETGHTQESEELRRQQEAYNRVMAGRPQLTPEERAFASRNQATYDAAEAMDAIHRSSDDPDWQRWLRTGRNRPEHGGPHTPDMTDMEGRAFRPNYDEPDPFDRSNPEEARQAKAIEDMNETLGE